MERSGNPVINPAAYVRHSGFPPSLILTARRHWLSLLTADEMCYIAGLIYWIPLLNVKINEIQKKKNHLPTIT